MAQLSLIQTVKLLSFLFISLILYSISYSYHSHQEVHGSSVSGMSNPILFKKRVNESLTDINLAEFQAASLRAFTKMTEINRHSNFQEPTMISEKKVTGIQSPAERDSSNTDRWASMLRYKLQCLHGSLRSGGIFLYHMRKAAGTTIRDMLVEASTTWRVPFYESEGISLNRLFLEENLLLVTSLRDPIDRIFSLYWYEHVGWFDGVLHQTEKCKSLKVWVDGWRDGSQWKNDFINQNPGSVYVEIENYYVKALSGWIGPAPVGETEYTAAVAALDKFDVVFVTEWINQDAQQKAMSALFSMQIGAKDTAGNSNKRSAALRSGPRLGHQVKGDGSVKQRLEQTLAGDKVCLFFLFYENYHENMNTAL